MNDSKQPYNPADDDNQGVIQLLAQAEEANSGVAQVERMNPVTAQGPEPVKEEVNEDGADAVNDDMLAEEDIESGEANEKEMDSE